jgi:hypothetical protein
MPSRKLKRRDSLALRYDHPVYKMLVDDLAAYRSYPGAPSCRTVLTEDGRIVAFGDEEAIDIAFERFTGGALVETVRIKNPTPEQIAAALAQAHRPALPGPKPS